MHYHCVSANALHFLHGRNLAQILVISLLELAMRTVAIPELGPPRVLFLL